MATEGMALCKAVPISNLYDVCSPSKSDTNEVHE
jgi:hypothetical protein